MSLASDFAEYIASFGLGEMGASQGWGIFVGGEPDQRNDLITLYDTGGNHDNQDGGYIDASIQVRVKAASYVDGHKKSEDIKKQIIGPTDRILDSYRVSVARLISDIALIGRDDNNFYIFTVNFQIMATPL